MDLSPTAVFPEVPRARYRLAAVGIVTAYLVAVWITGPQGSFPLNDDWTYTRSAFSVGAGEGLRIDEWSAPSLVGQSLYGGLLVRCTGPSFTALRLSTVALAAATALVLMLVFSRLRAGAALAATAVLAWVFNPLYFCLSLTFMTEIPFLFFIAIAFLLFARYVGRRRPSILLLCSLSLGYAFLIRQTSVLFLVSFLAVLLFESRADATPARRFRDVALLALPAGIMIAGYYCWLWTGGGATPATRRKFELLRHLTAEQLVGNTLGMFFHLSFLLLPVWLVLLPRIVRAGRGFRVGNRLLAGGFWAALAIFGLAWFRLRYGVGEYLPSAAYHARMPFLLNVLYDTGLGPVTLDPTYYLSPATPVYPRAWLAVTLVTALGAALLGYLLTLASARLGLRAGRGRPLLLAGFLSFIAVAAFEIVFSHLQEGGLFDRHLLTALLPFLVFIVGISSCPDASPQRTGGDIPPAMRALALIAAIAISVFSVAATHDYLAWNRVRWELGRELLAGGVDSLAVSGGFEFNAWQNYDKFRARGNIGKIYYWWYDRRDYLIAMHQPEGYRVLRTRDFYSWVHRRNIPLYGLKKQQ